MKKIILTIILLSTISCNNNNEEPIPIEILTIQERLDNNETPLEIFKSSIPLSEIYGNYYKGGYIFYLDTNSGKGMITGKNSEIFANIYWGGCSYSFETSSELWSGKSNTSLLKPYCINPLLPNKNNPIKICESINRNGYNDWFLPSKNELFEMINNLVSKNIDDIYFSHSLYWSSSNIDFDLAWAVNKNVKEASERYKNPSYQSLSIGVRAIRYFDN